MLTILKPVFESIWKRRETKIFIGLAILTPTFILISTFLPEEANFYQPSVAEGYELFSFTGMEAMMHGIANSLVLPILALFYLTYTVFRGEVDNHTLFLYKDIKRSDMFWAKAVSLIGIIFLYSGAIFLTSLVCYYARIGHMDYASLNFWAQDPAINATFFQTFFGESFSMVVCVFLATYLSLKKGLGVTMATSFVYLIVLMVINNFGLGFLSPLGNRDALYEGVNFGLIFGLSALATVVYSLMLAYITLKHFKKMEY
ncbi:hypothetical protein [Streptococcus ovuberis]|uniref:ABC-2 family transporter protein n=1 Tax=Streptococcus ovuberis TaxID=1936207 RepID=A0A7X6MXI2_9STRE|nr:hypothetical protein [Streptococcus ovuberis]NKZ19318.1 hypothetical protein [Streptococcus ovuberis]